MKKILALLLILPALAWSQKVSLLDSASFVKMEPGTFTYLNLSVVSEFEIEETADLVLDLSSLDAPSNYDSVQFKVGEKLYSFSELQPIYVEHLKNSTDLQLLAFSNGDTLEFAQSKAKVLALKITRLERPVFVNDTVVFGILAFLLGLVFYTAHLKGKFWKRFYTIVPALLLCYLLPALFDYFGLISKDYSNLYSMAKDYLLPAALILMTLGIDFKGLINLGPKALIMFFTGSIGVVLGGPIAIMVYAQIDPSVVGGEGYDAAWRGFSTLAGSWIGGGPNQAAMLETYKYNPDLYGKMVTVDIVVANIWMAFLLWSAARAEKFDRWLKADSSAIENLKTRMTEHQLTTGRQANLTDYMVILGLTFMVVGISHYAGTYLSEFFTPGSTLGTPFFWIVLLATTGGLLLSVTKFRSYEGAGASKLGSVFIYILVATIGMKMELQEAVKEPQLILVGIIWMMVHVGIMFLVARLIKAPYFFLAVGSKANIGGAASAPVVAAAFHPSLASVGALLAVLGYAIGTYGGILCAEIMSRVAP